jgi:hypothetical protein
LARATLRTLATLALLLPLATPAAALAAAAPAPEDALRAPASCPVGSVCHPDRVAIRTPPMEVKADSRELETPYVEEFCLPRRTFCAGPFDEIAIGEFSPATVRVTVHDDAPILNASFDLHEIGYVPPFVVTIDLPNGQVYPITLCWTGCYTPVPPNATLTLNITLEFEYGPRTERAHAQHETSVYEMRKGVIRDFPERCPRPWYMLCYGIYT